MIRERAAGPVEDVELRGPRTPRPTPEALEAIARRERSSSARRTRCSRSTRSWPCSAEALRRRDRPRRRRLAARARRGAQGPDRRLPAWAGRTLDSDGIADHYDGLIDGLVADQRAERVPTLETDVELRDPEARRRVAREVLDVRRRASVTLAGCGPSRSCPSSPSAAPSSGSATRSARPARALAAAMVADVLDALARVPELDEVIVVTAEPVAAARGADAGARVVHDPVEAGQSAAAVRGIDAALERGAERVLLVPGDCPALDPREVAALLRATRAARRGDRPGPPRDRHQRAAADAAGRDARRRSARARSPATPRCARAAGADGRGRRGAVARARRRHARRPRGAARRAGRARRRPPARALLHRRSPGVTGSSSRAPRPARGPARRRPRRADRRPPASSCRHRRARGRAQGRLQGRGPARRGSPTSCPARGRARSPPSTARTRATSRSCSRDGGARARRRGRLICRTRHGFVCANAGVDASNAAEPGHARAAARSTPTPRPARCARGCPAAPRWSSPTRSAARGATASARSRSASPGWRPLEDWRGRPDTDGPRAARDGDRRSPTRPPPPPTSSARRTRASPRCACAASSATSPPTTAPAWRALVRPLEDDLFR